MKAFLIVLLSVLVIVLIYIIKRLNHAQKEISELERNNTDTKNSLKAAKLELKKLEETNFFMENQIRAKSKDLIIKTRDLDEKNHLIGVIHSKIADAVQHPAKAKNRIHEIDLELEHFIKVEDHTFEMQMDELNQAFMKLLKSKYPEITPHDQRICLYIKTGMSSLEMAELMNVLPSSIYISRSRLRKKLGLGIDQDLYGFLNDLD
jgi:DNA-binding CsgD family transcriptional regulator